jgi:AcrR family transcriptional regulator
MSNPTQERRHARARTEILESAARAFAKKGFHGTSMDDVAREVGMSPSSLYRYFEGKEVLYRAMVDNIAEVVLAPFSDPLLPRCPLTNDSSGCCAASWQPLKHNASSSSLSRRTGPPWTGNLRAQVTPSAMPIIVGWRRFEPSSRRVSPLGPCDVSTPGTPPIS